MLISACPSNELISEILYHDTPKTYINMKPKKTKKADLESKRGIFLQIGLIVTLGIILAAFEWIGTPNQYKSLGLIDGIDLDEEFAQITREKEIKPPPPPPPKVAEVLNIIEDNDIIENEFFIEDVEAEQDMVIEFEPYIDDEVVDDIPFIIVEDMPSFQGGGLEKFRDWVFDNLRYPEIAAENGISGKVYIRFVVNAMGQLEEAVVIRGVDQSIDQESLRVVKSSPIWEPGKNRGQAVRVLFTLPIDFVLQ